MVARTATDFADNDEAAPLCAIGVCRLLLQLGPAERLAAVRGAKPAGRPTADTGNSMLEQQGTCVSGAGSTRGMNRRPVLHEDLETILPSSNSINHPTQETNRFKACAIETTQDPQGHT